jgi:magnesium-transporting ATPase (P-type)
VIQKELASIKQLYGALKTLGSSFKGLTGEEVKKRLQKYVSNKIAEEKNTSRLSIFVRQFFSPLLKTRLISGVHFFG